MIQAWWSCKYQHLKHVKIFDLKNKWNDNFAYESGLIFKFDLILCIIFFGVKVHFKFIEFLDWWVLKTKLQWPTIENLQSPIGIVIGIFQDILTVALSAHIYHMWELSNDLVPKEVSKIWQVNFEKFKDWV